jgi:hypothetical protein
LGEDGHSFGEYDLVIDAMGLHSKLRHHRGARALVASSISRCHTQAAAAAATVHDTRGVESTL